MDYTVLENSTLFREVPAKDLRTYLEQTPHHIQCYDKEETIFHLIHVMAHVTQMCIRAKRKAPALKQAPVNRQKCNEPKYFGVLYVLELF